MTKGRDEMVPVRQHMANLRRKGAKNGLGKDPDRAAERAAQLTAIDEDWDCPWPLDWQRHYRLLADRLQQQKEPAIWARLLPEQQERLTALGVRTDQAPSPAPAASRGAKGPSRAQQAFQRGLAALAQWVEREGTDRPVPRAHGEEIAVEGEAEPVIVKLGVWVSNTKSRRDKLTTDQLDSLAKLGIDWA